MANEREEKNEQRPEESPLAVPKPKVSRFNRRLVFVAAVIFFLLLVFSVVAALSSKKRVQGQELPKGLKEEKNLATPTPADPLLSAPGNYGELRGVRPLIPQQHTGTALSQQQLQQPQQHPGATTSPQQPQQASYSYGTYPVTQAPTPEGGGRAAAQEQRLKDAASAASSPVTFGSGPGETGQQTRQETPPTPPALPLTEGEKVSDKTSLLADDQNMQGEKRAFSGERNSDSPYLKTTLLPPISQYEIKAGAILPALLITGINSDLPGQLVAQIRENVYDTVTGNYLLIPQGTRLIGEYDSKVAFGQERILVVWTRLIMPNGDSLSLEGMPGTDLSGYAGVTGKVNNHYGKLITGVVLGSVIGAGAQVAVGGQGTAINAPSFGQLAVSGAAQNINQVGQQHTQKVLNMQPTIEVTPGDKINVFVTKDMIIKPYTNETGGTP